MTVCLLDVGRQRLDAGAIGDVECESRCFAATGTAFGVDARSGRFAFGGIAAGQHHLHAELHQLTGNFAADATIAAGDYRDLASHHACRRRVCLKRP